MFAKKFAFPAAVLAVVVAAAPVGASHHEHHNQAHLDPARVSWSGESRRLADECRRDPSVENRAALRRQLERDFDRFIAGQRAKLKPGKKHNEARRRIDTMIRERERTINAAIRLLVDGQEPSHRDKKPKPSRKSR